ncbi:superfamily member 1-like [Podarcis lilfordi]|uniref:Superfamily member 1-like n=1 Tax=Podarcis lilfordi TaxID=74358 RepID=A0AA35PNJ7_9SAUR|nr:superfamily member 1-like [Podarcis lilfordi]
MEVLFLVPVLVFLHLVPQPASSAGSLPPPKLSVQTNYPKYFEGERIVLICSAFLNRTVEGYRFFNQDGQQILKMAADPYQKGRLIFRAEMSKMGNYSCDYWIGKADTEVTSARSNSISLQVKAPEAPSLSLNPSLLEYNLGDNVSLVCSAPPERKEVKEFQFYSDKEEISVVPPYGNVYTHNMSIMEPKDVGSFMCGYVVDLSGRKVISKKSNSVTIVQTVNGNLPHLPHLPFVFLNHRSPLQVTIIVIFVRLMTVRPQLFINPIVDSFTK